MPYPLISEYIDAILSPEDSFDELKYLQPVLDMSGQPIMSSGNFAVVFKMIDGDGKYYALKCFLRDQEKRADKYRLISERLKDVCSPYFVEVRYYEKELFVDSKQTDETEFPVLLMDWVEGMTLNNYIRHISQDEDSEIKLKFLAFCFGRMSSWLLRQDFAHGDIKPDNVLVKEDGSLVLIDYDGMFVPQMEYAGYQHGDEIGSPGFRHPQRTADDFSSTMDDFSLIVILLSLKIIACHPDLWNDDGSSDKLLFSEADYLDPLGSRVLCEAYSNADEETKRLFGLFYYSLATKNLKGIEPGQLMLNNPFRILIENYSADKRRWIDNDGLEYSYDHKCLLYVGRLVHLKTLSLPVETRFIAEEAIDVDSYFHPIAKLILPEGLLYIGRKAFSKNPFDSINLPNSLMYIDGNPFCGYYDSNPWPLRIEGDGIFNSSNRCVIVQGKLVAVISNEDIDELIIPKNVSTIVEGAFSSCKHINKLCFNATIPDFDGYPFLNTKIGYFIHEKACKDKHGLIKDNKLIGFVCDTYIDYVVPTGVCSIAPSVFEENWRINSVVVSECVEVIGHNCFKQSGLSKIILPESLIELGESCFESCKFLRSVNLPNSLEIIRSRCFYNCSELKSMKIPNKIKNIYDRTFTNCESLETIELPESLEYIGAAAFNGCSSLRRICFNKELREIRKYAFGHCKSLREVQFSSSNIIIDKTAFEYCPHMTIRIPSGTLDEFERLFWRISVTFIEY